MKQECKQKITVLRACATVFSLIGVIEFIEKASKSYFLQSLPECKDSK